MGDSLVPIGGFTLAKSISAREVARRASQSAKDTLRVKAYKAANVSPKGHLHKDADNARRV